MSLNHPLSFDEINRCFDSENTEPDFRQFWVNFLAVYEGNRTTYSPDVIGFSVVEGLHNTYSIRIYVLRKRQATVEGGDETLRSLAALDTEHAYVLLLVDARRTGVVMLSQDLEHVVGFFHFNRKSLKPLPDMGPRPVTYPGPRKAAQERRKASE